MPFDRAKWLVAPAKIDSPPAAVRVARRQCTTGVQSRRNDADHEEPPIATYEVVWVDTFTATPLEGNACAVFVDARGLEPPAMLAIAREINLSETAFVFPSDQADFAVRYYMPVAEIPFAGHPTIATVHALCQLGTIPVERSTVTLQMPAGRVPVTIDRSAAHGPRYSMSQAEPVFLSQRKRGPIAKALGLKKSDLFAGELPQVVSTGVPQLQIALASRAALDRIDVDRRLLFPPARDFLSAHVFAVGGDEYALHARHFADVGDILEDPFTGSATGGMAAYCARYGIVTEREYRVAQGMHVKRPGFAEVAIGGAPPAIGRISVAGQAVTVLRGTLEV